LAFDQDHGVKITFGNRSMVPQPEILSKSMNFPG